MPSPVPHPLTLKQLEIVTRRQLAGLAGGAQLSLLRGQGLEFTELRAYQQGDELRHLDHAATARTGQLQIRHYREERNRELLLLTDLSASVTPAKRRLLLETSALLLFAAAQQRDRVGLLGFSDRIELLEPPRPGLQQARKLLHQLLELQPRGRGTDLALPLVTARALLRKPALLVLITDGHTELPAALPQELAARHELLCFLLRDPAEANLTGHGLLQLQDAESAATLTIDLSHADATSAWHRYDERLQAELTRLGIPRLRLTTGEPPAAKLIRFFQQRRRGA